MKPVPGVPADRTHRFRLLQPSPAARKLRQSANSERRSSGSVSSSTTPDGSSSNSSLPFTSSFFTSDSRSMSRDDDVWLALGVLSNALRRPQFWSKQQFLRFYPQWGQERTAVRFISVSLVFNSPDFRWTAFITNPEESMRAHVQDAMFIVRISRPSNSTELEAGENMCFIHCHVQHII